MKKSARILITTECHNNCEYCCNKLPEVQKRIKFTTFDEVVKMDYDIVCITGGEPLLVMDKLLNLAESLYGKNVYVYTAIDTERYWRMDYSKLRRMYRLVHGINYGIHNAKEIPLSVLRDTAGNTALRLYIQDTKYKSIPKALKKEFEWKLWKMNDCETNEDIYII